MMNKIDIDAKKVAIFSDYHWGKSRDSDVKLKIASEFIDKFISEIKERNISTALFLGDWFDNRNLISVKTQNLAYEALKKFSEANIKLYMIVGNHDSYFKDTIVVNSIRLAGDVQNVFPIEKLTEMRFINSDTTALLSPWDSYNSTLIDKQYDVSFGHFDFQGAKLKGMINQHGHSAGELLKAAPLVFSGHFHLREEYEYKLGKIVTVGCPFELDWGDYENIKGYYILDTETMQYEFIENTKSPKHVRIFWSKILSRKEKFKNLKGNYVRLVIDKKPKYDDVMKVISYVNTKLPIKACESEFVYNQNFNTLDDLDFGNGNTEVVSMDHLEYMIKFIEKYFKDSDEEVDDMDIDIMIKLTRSIYNETMHE